MTKYLGLGKFAYSVEAIEPLGPRITYSGESLKHSCTIVAASSAFYYYYYYDTHQYTCRCKTRINKMGQTKNGRLTGDMSNKCLTWRE